MTGDPGSLANLRDLAMPDPVSLWPPAPGAWIILAGLAAASAVWLLAALRRRHANAYRRAALVELDSIVAAGHSDAHAIEQVSEVMKRAALVAFPREQVAPLSGAKWADFVAETAGDRFDARVVRRMLSNVYGSGDPGAKDVRKLIEQARIWVLEHRAPSEVGTP